VHVADVTRWLRRGDAIDTAAFSNVESSYKPNAVHMLPMSALESMTLSNERQNYALTFHAQVNQFTGEVLEYEVFPSLLSPLVRLTFEEADNLIQGKAIKKTFPVNQEALSIALRTMQKWAKLRSSYRILAGKGKISEKDSPHLSEVIVREFVQLAAEVAQKFAQERNLEMISYMVTGPLRRYEDIIGHWQIKSSLRNTNPPFSTADLQQAKSILKQQKQVRGVQNYHYMKTQNLKALQQHYRTQIKMKNETTLDVTVTEIKLGSVKVLFPEFQLFADVVMDDAKISNLQIGDKLKIRITTLNPLKRILEVDYVTIK